MPESEAQEAISARVGELPEVDLSGFPFNSLLWKPGLPAPRLKLQFEPDLDGPC